MMRIELEVIDLAKHVQLYEIALVYRIRRIISCRRIFGNSLKITEVSNFPPFGNFWATL